MTHRDRPDELSSALRALTRRPASPGFTDGVVARLDARDQRRRTKARLLLAAEAALVVLALGALFVYRPGSPPPSADAHTQADELRRQYQTLQAELEQLQRASDRSRAVLYLGASDGYDLVLDLEPLLDQGVGAPVVPAMQDLRVRPAYAEATGRQP